MQAVPEGLRAAVHGAHGVPAVRGQHGGARRWPGRTFGQWPSKNRQSMKTHLREMSRENGSENRHMVLHPVTHDGSLLEPDNDFRRRLFCRCLPGHYKGLDLCYEWFAAVNLFLLRPKHCLTLEVYQPEVGIIILVCIYIYTHVYTEY